MLRGGLIGADTQEFLDLCLINSALISSSSSSQCVVFMCILKFLLWMKCNHTTASLPCLLSDFHKWLLVIKLTQSPASLLRCLCCLWRCLCLCKKGSAPGRFVKLVMDDHDGQIRGHFSFHVKSSFTYLVFRRAPPP